MHAWLLVVAMFIAGPGEVPQGAPAHADVAPPGEPGVGLLVEGVVYGPDGKTLAGASVYAYQTDARGHYRPEEAMANRNPRLKALLRSDAQGRYSFRTVRPGSYPSSRVPAHIHYVVSAAGCATRVFEIVFEDDPLLTDDLRALGRQEGTAFSLRPVERGADGLRVRQDVRLQRP